MKNQMIANAIQETVAMLQEAERVSMECREALEGIGVTLQRSDHGLSWSLGSASRVDADKPASPV